MPSATVYSHEGKELGSIDLRDDIFNVRATNSLIHKVTMVEAGNARWSTAHTKDRSDVRGGGRKPWRQKGTGRARAGSSRSPIWRGGGVTGGPKKDRNFTRSTNAKERSLALRALLSSRVSASCDSCP